MEIFLGNGVYKNPARPNAYQFCTNWYPYYEEGLSLSSVILRSMDGVTTLDNFGTGETNRGFIEFNSELYTVQGSSLYHRDAQGTVTNIGTITGSTRVYMSHNNTQICIVVPGSTAYIYSVEDGLSEITDSEFNGPADSVAYMDGYFVFSNGTQLFTSGFQNGNQYDALDFAEASRDPDDIAGTFVYKNQLYVFGDTLTEVYETVGGNGFPYQRIEGLFMDKGISAPFAITECNGLMFFLGRESTESIGVWMGDGVNPIKISNIGMDNELKAYTDEEISERCYAYNFSNSGELFAVFAFPATTYAYCVRASQKKGEPVWVELSSKTDEVDARWAVSGVVNVNGDLIVGNINDGKIGILDENVFTQFDDDVRRVWSSPTVGSGTNPIFVNRLEVTLDSGKITDDSDPDLQLEISDDGGYTWTTMEPMPVGEKGNYGESVYWTQLGYYPLHMLFLLRWTSPYDLSILRIDVQFDNAGLDLVMGGSEGG